MEQSHNKFDYNEKIAPTAPISFGQNHQGSFGHHGIQTQSGFDNSGFQPDFNQNSGFVQLSHQPITTHPTFVPHKQKNTIGHLNRNCRRHGSIAGGLLLMLNSGLQIGWGIWRLGFIGFWSWSLGVHIFVTMAWSVGAFFGGFIGAVLTPILKKNAIYYITASVMIVGNLLFIIWDADIEAIIVGRLLIGGAHGIAYVAIITHAGENSAKNMRGKNLSTINFMLYLGIFVSVIITGTVRFTWLGLPATISAERIIGIIGLIFAVASIPCTITLTVETVPFLLRRNNRDSAMINLKILRGLRHETLELIQEMEEFNLMIVQDKQNNGNIFTNGNAKPLVLMIIMRLMVALTNNFLINFVAIAFVLQIFYFYQFRLVPLAVVAPRLAMSMMQIFYADFFKRKAQISVSSTLAVVVIMLVGILFNTMPVNSFYTWRVFSIVIAVLFLVFQLACSIGMDQMQDVYLSEAFSTAKKPWSISFVTGIEHLFHIFMIGMYFEGDFFFGTNFFISAAQLNSIIFVTAAMVILFGFILVFTLPETQKLSLKQAKDSFLNHSIINLTSPFA